MWSSSDFYAGNIITESVCAHMGHSNSGFLSVYFIALELIKSKDNHNQSYCRFRTSSAMLCVFCAFTIRLPALLNQPTETAKNSLLWQPVHLCTGLKYYMYIHVYIHCTYSFPSGFLWIISRFIKVFSVRSAWCCPKVEQPCPYPTLQFWCCSNWNCIFFANYSKKVILN